MIRRLIYSALAVLPSASIVFAQESNRGGERGPFDTLGPLKIVNTLIFAALLGYFIYKKAPGFFNARSADIQRAIREATGLKMEADLRYSAIDRKMATLSEEVKRLREEAASEMERDYRRIRQDTEEGIRRIQANADAQIQAFRMAGTRTLREYAADAALDSAAKRLTDSAPADLRRESLREFSGLVERDRK